MTKASQYRELAGRVRYRACLATNAETREQLLLAEHDLRRALTEDGKETSRRWTKASALRPKSSIRPARPSRRLPADVWPNAP